MEGILLIFVILVSIPVVILAFEVLCALLPQRKMVIPTTSNRPAIAVLMPAHNESGTIERTLENIKSQITDGDRLLVVADNCTDNTASIARQYDVEVIERFNTEKKGKGYALDYGISYLKKKPPQVVIIIDADCFADEGAVTALAKLAAIKNRPVQALYLMSHENPGMHKRITEFAWLVKNYVRPRGLYNIGMPCQLMGTGMAFPWGIIAGARLATGNIVEDIKMGLDMAVADYAPIFLPDARITSMFPENITGEKNQKKRWEHGHLSTIISVVPGTMIDAMKKRSLDLLVLSLDLMVPPVALLGLMLIIMLLLSMPGFLIGGWLIFLFSITLLVIFASTMFMSWLVWGRTVLSFTDILRVPFYIMRKIPIYIGFIFKRQKQWTKTDRG